jgi:protein involved in polysaccharide export with SLBB domain
MTHAEGYADGVGACSVRGEQPVSKHQISPWGFREARKRAGHPGRTRFPRDPGLPTRWFALGVFLLLGACLVLAGCGDKIRRPTPEELARFQAADPPVGFSGDEGPGAAAGPRVDMNRVLQAKIVAGPYRAVPGDVLRLEMTRFLEQRPTDTAAAAADSRQIYNCRIADDGTIVLPIVGTLAVAGKSLAQIESAVAAQYYPKYVAAPLPVYVSVTEYQTQRVSIVGAVTTPGIHALRHDQMSLVSLLMQAGGITTQGAAVIRITRANRQEREPATGDGALKVVPSSIFGPPDVLRRYGPRSSRMSTPAWHAVFEREGPLRTTGWLSVAQERGRVSIRQWLDLGNEPQRREFLIALASQAKQPGVEDLGEQLARLGAYLDAQDNSELAGTVSEESAIRHHVTPGFDRGPQSAVVNPLPGWLILDHGRFVTAAETPSEEEAATPVRQVSRDSPADALPLETQTLVLPVRGLNIPFADVVLVEGDTVVVEPPQEQSVAVVGLVTKPGNMPYPPGVRYNLIQAIAYAGGLDLVADPRYVSVYRLAPDGQIASVTFQLVDPHRQQKLTGTLALPLKPGDVVSVEHTPRTRMNVFLDRVFRITLGLYLNPWDAWNN